MLNFSVIKANFDEALNRFRQENAIKTPTYIQENWPRIKKNFDIALEKFKLEQNPEFTYEI